MIKLWILKWRDYPVLSRWALNIIKRGLYKSMERRSKEEVADVMMEARIRRDFGKGS